MGCLPELKPILAYRAVCLVYFLFKQEWRSGISLAHYILLWDSSRYHPKNATQVLFESSRVWDIRGARGSLSFWKDFIRVINAMDIQTDSKE